jgi:hypothetical protein
MSIVFSPLFAAAQHRPCPGEVLQAVLSPAFNPAAGYAAGLTLLKPPRTIAFVMATT